MSSIALTIITKTCNPCSGDSAACIYPIATALVDILLTITGIVLTILGASGVIPMPLWGVLTCGSVTGIIALGLAYVVDGLTGCCCPCLRR